MISENSMEPTEIIRAKATDETVGCDGGGGALGHPLVYLRFEGKSNVDCYYCSRRFARPDYFANEAPLSA